MPTRTSDTQARRSAQSGHAATTTLVGTDDHRGPARDPEDAGGDRVELVDHDW